MRFAPKVNLAALALVMAAAMSGCGTPGAPQPPSLNLPDRVADLSAARAGDRVSLSWTMPKKNTDRMLLKGEVPFRVCRREGSGTCVPTKAGAGFAPGSKATFAEELPQGLASGSPRVLSYFVELPNRNGRSAGMSNGAAVLAGEAPDPVAGLELKVRKEGVELRWTANRQQADVRLRRTLLTPPKAKESGGRGPLGPSPEPVEQNLLVADGASLGRALDNTIHFGETYEYRAQRVVRVTVGHETLELEGELSAPVRIDAEDVFPPAVPAGLAAVATRPAPDAPAKAGASIDLSWNPNTEPDLAGYIVYRREGSSGWQRISSQQAVIGPAFADAHVDPGHTYIYAVSAVDQKGHESARSTEATETVPAD